jgi:signal transduction histidine kinase
VSQGQSQESGRIMANHAFARFSHVIAYVCLVGAMFDLVGYQAETAAPIALGVLPLVGTLVVLAVLDRRRSTFFSVLFLAVGGVSLYLVAVALMSTVPAVAFTNAPPLALVKVALILVTGSGVVPSANMAWSAIGFGVGVVATLLAAWTAHGQVRLDFPSIGAELGLLAILVTGAITRATRLRVQPELDRAVIDEEVSEVRYRIEVRAAALMHDMVLNHLAAVANSEGDTLRPELARQIARDLHVLMGDEWLSDPPPQLESRARQDWHGSSLRAAVEEARELSLVVDVTGDLSAIGQLNPERDVAVGLAVKQCLVNVLKHAQVERAELVVIGSAAEVSVMVIDAGRGFSEQLVAADRLGLKQSVRLRIESVGGDVRVWSTPGRGTTVMIRVPATSTVTDSVGAADE